MAHDIGLVVFDLGRVLVRICRDWQHACEVAGLAPPPEERVAANRARVHDAICRVEVAQITGEQFCLELAPVFGVSLEDMTAVMHQFTRGPYPGAAELLDQFAAAGVPTACLSNTNESHWRLMGDPASHTYFPFHKLTHAFASHLVRLRKPDDAIYAHVERATGVPAEKIVFFDDVEDNVEAAVRRRWRGCHVDPRPDEPLPQVRAFLNRHGLSL
jgi:putative hydrolase of the HAD superfamily